MSGVSETYSTQRKVWKRAKSSRYSGSSGTGPLKDIGYQGSGSDSACSAGICDILPAGQVSETFFIPRTDLGKSLWDMRTSLISQWLPTMSRDDVDRVVRERRG